MAYTITEQDDAISKVGPEDSDTYLNSKYLNG